MGEIFKARGDIDVSIRTYGDHVAISGKKDDCIFEFSFDLEEADKFIDKLSDEIEEARTFKQLMDSTK
jgi:hypothetical protein